ncbi:hypothetical protein BIY29_05460 [Brenneria alni]|uniref:Uncharacterized protein n=1 Tax=Brenneria alni TaxID=71656 RepID=A0A421DR63_9GAMM|nr:hypothetical protein BIY29_05460 [Brenneria alni]
MDIENLTGNETPEELEALLDSIGDVEVSDTSAADTTVNAGDLAAKTNPLTQQENKGDTNTSTPDVTAEQQVGTQQTGAETAGPEGDSLPKGILSRDGKHVIPYGVLEAERADKQRLAQSSQRTAAELAETKRQLDVLTRQINAAGLQPAQLPEKTQITPEQIDGVRDSFPELAGVLDALVQKVEYLQEQQPAAPAAQQSSGADPVMSALDATPDLKAWQTGDPDRFTLAVHIDETLKNDPVWKGKPLAERFGEVAKRTRAAYGEAVESAPPQDAKQPTAEEIQKKAAAALATAAAQLPASPSDVGSTTSSSAASPLEQAANADPEQLQAMFAGMTDAQIEALLEQVI